MCLRYAEFAASTLAGMAVDMFVLWICSHYLLDGSYWREYILSPFIGFEFAVFTNFVIAYFGVWRDRISARSTRYVLWCNLTAMCFSGLLNFALNEKVVFRLKKDKKTTSNL